jgi:hypothetical protein
VRDESLFDFSAEVALKLATAFLFNTLVPIVIPTLKKFLFPHSISRRFTIQATPLSVKESTLKVIEPFAPRTLRTPPNTPANACVPSLHLLTLIALSSATTAPRKYTYE